MPKKKQTKKTINRFTFFNNKTSMPVQIQLARTSATKVTCSGICYDFVLALPAPKLLQSMLKSDYTDHFKACLFENVSTR